MKYTITQSRLLYVLSMEDRTHRGYLKIGEVFVDNDVADDEDYQHRCKAVRDILDKRSYMQGKDYRIEYVECTTYAQQTKCYKADDVHRTLMANDIERKSFAKIDKEEADFWFNCSLMDVQDAIAQIKEGNGAGHGAIKFRPEQEKGHS